MSDNWKTNLGREKAVLYLLVLNVKKAKKDKLNQTSEQLLNAIGSAFDGSFDNLKQTKFLGKDASEILCTCIKKIKALMSKKGLTDGVELPAVLWLRIFKECSLQLSYEVLANYKAWMSNRDSRWLFFYMRLTRDTETHVGSVTRIILQGKKLNGYSFEQMLLLCRRSEDDPSWPYNVIDWKTKRYKIVFKKNIATESKDQKTVNIKRKKRTLEAVKKNCGSSLVSELEAALGKAVTRKSSFIQPKNGQGRYSCKLSLNELAIVMMNAYKPLAKCKISTIKNALSFFVQCPRGKRKIVR
jgi:hypothetical protein